MELLLNVGSGQRPFPKPWVNVDCQAKWSPDVVCDCRSMPMFKNGSADVIVLHQVLEHFECSQGTAVLRECHRILGKAGSLIVSVPDIEKLAKMLLRREMTHETYAINTYGAYMGDEADFHRFGYTVMTLMKTVYNAGFQDVRTFDYRSLSGADIARDDRWILCLEAIK